MKVALFSAKPFEEFFLNEANQSTGHEFRFFEPRLNPETAVLADGFPAVCGFVTDSFDADVLQKLHDQGTRYVALRSAGFNNVDLAAAERLGIRIARVPAYSPYAVAEHAVALMLVLNRKIHRAFHRVREGNFDLNGLMGFDMKGKTVGIVGTGKIGAVAARILAGFGCELLGYDVQEDDECKQLGLQYVERDELFRRSDIITLHAPLNPQTHHMIGAEALDRMKDGVMLINTSRGGLVDTRCLIDALKRRKIGALGLDVYEEEGDLFFEDLSNEVIEDDVFARLLTFPNVLITGHQAFFTEQAVRNIAQATVENLRDFEQAGESKNEISQSLVNAG